jgi:type IV fimbrial biogenesis protein FimT
MTYASRKASRRKTQGNGFTLVELLVVISVAAILAAIAVPSFKNTILMNRADTASNQFVAALSMARSEAVRQGTQVSVSSNSNSTNWGTQGWSVTVLSNQAATGTSASLGLSSPMTSYGTVSSVIFGPMGRMPAGTAAQSFLFCPDGSDVTKAYLVTVAPSGRARVVAPSNGQAPANDLGTVETACNNPQ